MTKTSQDCISGELRHPSVKEKAVATNSTRKRTASVRNAAGEHEVGEIPAKKAKVRIDLGAISILEDSTPELPDALR